jgi:hypothetical protein
MRDGLLAGAIAGTVGTLALDVASYLDMVVRGRPASDVPALAAGRLADQLGVDLGDGEQADNRRSALGALLGYSTGVAVGAAYGVARRGRGRRRRPVRPIRSGLALGATAMTAANLPLVAMGLTDPREWGLAGWVSDIVPHLAYGVAGAVTYRAIVGDRAVR